MRWMWLIRLLNRWGWRHDYILCMRQEDTWCWPDHLGKLTPDICDECDAPVYVERQNRFFRKICNRCVGACLNDG